MALENTQEKEKIIVSLFFQCFYCTEERNHHLKKKSLTEWCLTPFSMLFQLYHTGQCTFPCSPAILFTSDPHNILSMPLTDFPHEYCRNNDDSNETGMNPVTITIISPWKEYMYWMSPWIEPATSCS